MKSLCPRVYECLFHEGFHFVHLLIYNYRKYSDFLCNLWNDNLCNDASNVFFTCVFGTLQTCVCVGNGRGGMAGYAWNCMPGVIRRPLTRKHLSEACREFQTNWCSKRFGPCLVVFV
jgi:hypothetical protein